MTIIQQKIVPENTRALGGTEIVMGQILMVGTYLGGPHASFADGFNWYTFRGYHYSLKRSEMKIKPKSKCKHDKPLING